MIEWILWPSVYLSLFVTIFWMHIYYSSENNEGKLKKYPKISVVVPAYNEEKTVAKTIESIFKTDYPKNKIEVIAVNHGSNDKTGEIIDTFGNKIKRIHLERKEGDLKSKTLNAALKIAKGELFTCLDADSYAKKDSFKNVVMRFNSNEKLGGVISSIRVNNLVNLWTRMQGFEYVFTSFIRKILSHMDSVFISGGTLSFYKTDLLRKLGGFDEKTLTEDMEMALRLHYHGYGIVIENKSMAYANVPTTFNGLLKQRVRWYRGFIQNFWKYKGMVFNKKYGILGTFQMPLSILSLFVALVSFFVLGYEVFDWFRELAVKIFILKSDFFKSFDFPEISKWILGFNLKIWFPIIIALGLVLILYRQAYKLNNEKWRNLFLFMVYLLYYPVLTTFHWIVAITKHLMNSKTGWR